MDNLTHREPLLSISDVADRLGVPVASIRRWRYRGTGPRAIKVGRHVRFRPEDLDAWLEANADPATPATAAATSKR